MIPPERWPPKCLRCGVEKIGPDIRANFCNSCWYNEIDNLDRHSAEWKRLSALVDAWYDAAYAVAGEQ